jgi:hypothetical protein
MGLEGVVSKRVDAPYRGGSQKHGMRLRTLRARRCSGKARRIGDNRRGSSSIHIDAVRFLRSPLNRPRARPELAFGHST